MTVAESAIYTEGIYQIELTDPVIGGADGIANLQAKQLASRTNWLKAAFEKIVDGTTSIAKALKLATARKISLGGVLSGSANFDGSADITINASFVNGVLTINSINGLSDALNGLSNTKQPSDATLTALANLTMSGNKLIYATAPDTFATADLTVFARTLLDDVDAATMRTTMGVSDAFGIGQSSQDLTGIIMSGSNNTNSSGKTKFVLVEATSGGGGAQLTPTVGGNTFPSSGGASVNKAFVCFPVAPGAIYSITANLGTITKIIEHK